MTDTNAAIGAILADALDRVRHVLRDPEGWSLAIYLGRPEDRENAYLVGNVEPKALAAGVMLLDLDGERLGTVNATGVITPDGKAATRRGGSAHEHP